MLVLLLAMLIGSFGCAKDIDMGFGAKKEFLGSKTFGESEVKIYGPENYSGDYKTVAFEETNNLCADNEGMGWVVLEEPLLGGLPSLGYKGTLPEVKAVSLSTGWSVIEQEPGVYDWSEMDEAIAYWAGLGKTINMRLCTDSLTLNQDVIYGCPPWLYEEPYNVPSMVNDGQIYTDLSNPVYQEQLEIFMKEFVSHFTNESYPYRDAIEVVELRGYGMVGEWHSGWNTYNSVEERVEALRKIIDIWREGWGDKLLVISCTYEFLSSMWGVTNAQSYEQFMYNMGYDYVLQNDNITFRRDGIAFALQEYDSRMALDYFYDNTGLPLFGEIGDGYHKHTDSDPYPLFEAMNEALHKWRVNYQSVIGWVAQDFGVVIEKETEMVEYFNRMMGYRLVPDRVQYSANVKAGGTLYLNTLWTNKAMGRCWKDHDLTVYLEDAQGNTVYSGTDARFDPVAINGGEPHFYNLQYALPESLANGTYTVKFAITDKEGNPAIEMPIAGNDGNLKYYLGEVTVGKKGAENLIDTDAVDENTNMVVVGNGKMTSRLVNVDGTTALVGSGNGVFAQGGKLENGKTYYISFEYKTDKDKSTIDIEDASKYVVGACTADGNWSDAYRWLDVSNLVSHRSVTIRVPNDGKEYKLSFGCENGAAAIAIDNISVTEADTIDCDFRINTNYTEKTEDGTYIIRSQIDKNWAHGLQLKQTLEPHSAYMLTFDARTVTDISGGAFFYVTLQDPATDWEDKYSSIESFSLNRIGSFWTPADYDYMKYSYVFNSGEYTEDWQLVFGVRDMGGVEIKNITLTKLGENYSYTSDAEVIEHNVVPDKGIDVDANGVVENFEAGVFNGGCMFPGERSVGIITKDTDKVISGKYSCYVANTREDSVNYEFNVFCRTNLVDMTFSANTSYKVKFKFKVIEDVRKEENGYFYCLAREDGSFLHDVGVYEWRSGYEVGEVYSVEYDFTTGNADNYYFMWGIRFYGALAIDDVTFEKIDAATVTTPVVTKGHAYEITQEVLYDR